MRENDIEKEKNITYQNKCWVGNESNKTNALLEGALTKRKNELALDDEIPYFTGYIDLFIKFPKIVCLLPACISRVNLFGL